MGSNSINLDLLRIALMAERMKMSRKAYALLLSLSAELETAHTVGA